MCPHRSTCAITEVNIMNLTLWLYRQEVTINSDEQTTTFQSDNNISMETTSALTDASSKIWYPLCLNPTSSIQRSEESGQGIYQRPAERLQQKTNQLPNNDNQNPPVLGGNILNRREERKTMLQQPTTVKANLTIAHPTHQSPEVTCLYLAAAQCLQEDNSNPAQEFNDHGTRVPSRTRKKRIVNGQTNQF